MKNEDIKAVLVEIHEANGELTPPMVVESAKPEESPIHLCFEWNDEKAGYEYRLYQARELIRQVYVVVEQGGEKVKEHIFFHTTNLNDEPVYHSKEVLIKNEGLLKEAERQAIVKLEIAERTLVEIRRLSTAGRYKKAQKYINKAIETMKRI